MRIGLVDLDTSHPQSWIPILRELGHEIVGVFDSGAVHPPDYALQFAVRNGISTVFPSLSAMADVVDLAIIHGSNWDTHVARARPFVERRKSLLIDKPMAGNLSDLRQMSDWARQGIRITGGSSLRFYCEVRQFLSEPPDERGDVHTTMVGCGVDEFNYGIHAYALLCGIMGPRVTSVRHLGEHGQHRIQINWADGRLGVVVIGGARQPLPFYATMVTDRQVRHLRPDPGRLYRSFLEAILPYLAGQSAQPPIPFDELIEPELCALAAKRASHEVGRGVHLSELSMSDCGYDGAAFVAQYHQAKYPGGPASKPKWPGPLGPPNCSTTISALARIPARSSASSAKSPPAG